MSINPDTSAPGPTTSTEKYTHSSALYYEDGDVVLSANDKDGNTVLFRVDKLFLKRHSPIFADLFALPAGPEKREEYDGVPIVHLPDCSEDVAVMLKAIYNG